MIDDRKLFLFYHSERGKCKENLTCKPRGTPESIRDTLFRFPESRSSKTSGFTFIQPDGPGCNSPVQRAKHTPFFAIQEWQKILLNRQKSKRLSNIFSFSSQCVIITKKEGRTFMHHYPSDISREQFELI